MSNYSTSAEPSAVICLQKVVDESLSPVVCQRALNLDTCLGRSLVLRIESDSVLSVVIDIYKGGGFPCFSYSTWLRKLQAGIGCVSQLLTRGATHANPH
jgi:hypothetical protein